MRRRWRTRWPRSPPRTTWRRDATPPIPNRTRAERRPELRLPDGGARFRARPLVESRFSQPSFFAGPPPGVSRCRRRGGCRARRHPQSAHHHQVKRLVRGHPVLLRVVCEDGRRRPAGRDVDLADAGKVGDLGDRRALSDVAIERHLVRPVALHLPRRCGPASERERAAGVDDRPEQLRLRRLLPRFRLLLLLLRVARCPSASALNSPPASSARRPVPLVARARFNTSKSDRFMATSSLRWLSAIRWFARPRSDVAYRVRTSQSEA